jgi:hypothetical protein
MIGGPSADHDAEPRITAMHIELDPADHEEPTWEVRHPSDPPRRRLDRRTRAMLAIAAALAIAVNAGAAWTYWRITGSETRQAADGSAVAMTLRGRSDLNRPLTPGKTGILTVTVTNDYDLPIRITALTPGVGPIVADAEHRDAGCADTAVTITKQRFEVSWDVRRNTLGAFTVPDGLLMRPNAAKACEGATFSVPLQAFGVRREVV